MKRNSAFMFLTLFLAFALVLAGCAGKSANTASSSPSSDKESTAAAAPESSQASDTASDKKVTLSMAMNVTATAGQNAYTEIVRSFEKDNPNITVDLQFPGDYENLLKVKMAANELPDIFDTHGWAIIRYGKYLTDLRDQSWASQLSDSIKNVVTDQDGKVYVLPVSEAKDGLSYNVSVLEKYGIEVPKTTKELMAAFEKIKKESKGEVVPYFFAGGDNWTIGQHFDEFATSLLISPNDNSAEALLNGSFDWSKWTPLAQEYKEMFEQGYFNKDVITAKFSDLPKLFATDKVAFFVGAPSFADDVYKINPNAKIGVMPVPAMVEGDEPNFSGGERNTMGVWNNTKYPEQAKKLLAYFAKEENMAKIANVMKAPAGLKGVKATHEFATYYDQYANIRVFPYFDRVYLPSGMWDVLCNSGAELLAGLAPEKFSDAMKVNVERLTAK